MLSQHLEAEYQRVTKKLTETQNELRQMPGGQLSCQKSGNYFKYYQCEKDSKTYLSTSDMSTIQQLAYKKYLVALEEDLEKEKKELEHFLNFLKKNPSKSAQILHENSRYAPLISPYLLPLSTELRQWAAASFPTNPSHPEGLVIKTNAGITVRSKSESMITSLLFQYKIPFRYECQLSLPQLNLYPDFTIRHPKTGDFYYWEHFGLMDDPAYLRNFSSKLQLYVQNGFIPSCQLITTYETKEHPIDLDYVDNLIHFYFLS